MENQQVIILFVFIIVLAFSFYTPIKVWIARQKLYKEAKRKAAKGNADGFADLGICYEFGYGVRKNLITANEHYHKAARMGSEIGRAKIAVFSQTPLKKVSAQIDMDALVKKALEENKTDKTL